MREQIAAAAAACRPPRAADTIAVVAVSKRQPDEAIAAAWNAGQRDFGENYVQQIAAKVERLDALAGIRWHLIGPLQSNKAAAAAHLCAWVHSIDRIKVARRLGAARTEAGADALDACVQVNLGDEASKSGVRAAETADLCSEVAGIDGLRLRGLMCMPEESASPELLRERFGQLRELKEDIQLRCGPLDTLSMGMSADFELAIEQGSTMVRIGSAIFGPRPE